VIGGRKYRDNGRGGHRRRKYLEDILTNVYSESLADCHRRGGNGAMASALRRHRGENICQPGVAERKLANESGAAAGGQQAKTGGRRRK
jgi:hypothetical protein